MSIFNEMRGSGHEQLLFCRDDDAGLRAIIAIHSTALGPAIGGLRMFPYASESDAIKDVLRLARGMTYKAAIAGLDLGGGQAVIIADPASRSEALFRAFGRHVESLGGRYITAEDMNTTVADMAWIRRETRWVTGFGTQRGSSGDPAPGTALGVYHGIRACLEVVFGSPDVSGRTIAIQGVGAVGYHLARHLHEAGARLICCDVSARAADRARRELGAHIVDEDDYYEVDADVLAPCAIGGTINAATIPLIRAPIVAGAANNQLDDERADAEALAAAGITYAPDYVISAGGLINVAAELAGAPNSEAVTDTQGIFNTVKAVLNTAHALGTTSVAAAEHLAEERINALSRLRRFHLSAPG